jgi:LEA14-like dessication related protein
MPTTVHTQRALCALALALVTANGCATLRRQAFAAPVVTMKDVRLAGMGTQGGRLDVVLSMYNPNGYRLDAEAIHYKVLVDTLELGSGTIDQRITMLRKDSTELRIPVSFGLREVLAASAMLTQRGSLEFRLIGDVRVATPFGDVTRSIDQRGTYDGVNISLLPRRK